MNIPELIRTKREGGEISPAQLKEFIDNYVAGQVEAYQVSAFLMAVFFRGMTPDEAAALTRSMIESGDQFDLSSIDGPKTDKHSTGGVGDKVSLILAPLIAAAGGIVPMVSGRGLGHTGGTLDKLDSIPGYRWSLSETELHSVLEKAGCAIIGQTDNFVPADKRLYALRDVTATVESIPLICASILSKKIAAGTEHLVMDVKCGSGAFMDSLDRALELADSLVGIGTALGIRVSALITQMSQPLGEAAGNALEVRETIDVLKGGGPADVREVTLALSTEMLTLSGLETDMAAARSRLESLLDSGAALQKFQQWIEVQGGDPRIIDRPELLEVSPQADAVVLTAKHAGVIHSMQTRNIGLAANALGAGRIKTTDKVDLSVGLLVHKKPGDAVEKGEPLVTIHHRDARGLEDARRLLAESILIREEPAEPLPLILDRR